MREEFPQFKKWWSQPRIAVRYNFRKEIDHPDVGLLCLEHTGYQICANRHLHLVITIPLPEHETEKKLKMLLTRREQRRGD